MYRKMLRSALAVGFAVVAFAFGPADVSWTSAPTYSAAPEVAGPDDVSWTVAPAQSTAGA